jgi:phosphoglycolate phosphatase-like HAD superfamily hydrolase
VTGYDAVLFDSDGVLVEPPTAETQAAATRAAFREVGVDDVAQRHVDAIANGVTVADLHDICADYGLESATFWAARERHDERSQLEQFRAGTRDRYDDVTAIAGYDYQANSKPTLQVGTRRFEADARGDVAWPKVGDRAQLVAAMYQKDFFCQIR